MTIEGFVKGVEQYYGEYRAPVRTVVTRWLTTEKFSERYLSAIFAELLKTFSGKYKIAPDLAEIINAESRVAKTWAESMERIPAQVTALIGEDQFVEPEQAEEMIKKVRTALGELAAAKRFRGGMDNEN